MAVVLIGGVLVSTFLTLFVVPCFYALAAGLENRDEHEARIAAALLESKGEGASKQRAEKASRSKAAKALLKLRGRLAKA
jgi:hypothetical protein